MLRSSNCVLTGKTPMEFAKLNECPLDPGTKTEHRKYISAYCHSPDLYVQYLLYFHRGIFYSERSGEGHTDPRAAVKESNHCGSGQEGCSWSLGD